DSIKPGDRRYFVQVLAWEMQNTSRLEIPFSQFPALVKQHFQLSEDKPDELAFFARDMQTQSYLIRDNAGNYRFAHKSIMEYFVARKLAPLLARGTGILACVLTDAIASFVHYLLVRPHKYEVRVED